MNQKNKHSPVIVRFSKHKNLLDFGFKKQTKKFFKKFEKDSKIDINSNNLSCYSFKHVGWHPFEEFLKS